MAEAAGAVEARAALDAEADDLDFIGQRRREPRRGRAVNRHQRAIQRSGHVHQPGIVGDHGVRAGQQINGFSQ